MPVASLVEAFGKDCNATMATPGYKPSPLGYGSVSQRSSPFRRPQSPASPATLRQTTPSSSPIKQGVSDGGARFTRSPVTSPISEFRSSRGRSVVDDVPDTYIPQQRSSPRPAAANTAGQGNALSQLQPSQVRTMREAFQILDRDSDGAVNREDVTDMLNQLGLPSSPSDVSQFFPPSAAQTMTMAMFLNSISTALAALSPSTELLSAFSAFDDDDSGQIDVAELRDALLHTAPEPGQQPLTASDVDMVINGFTGRRAFGKSRAGGPGKRGEVFRYQDFVNTIVGKNGGGEQASETAEEA